MAPRRRMNRRPKRISRPAWARKRFNPNKLRRQVHYYKRTFRVGDLRASYDATTGITTAISNALSFNLTQLPAYTEFTDLYDQYKINGISVKIQPLVTEGLASPLSGSPFVYGFPKLSTVIDYDDTNIPANENVMLQYGSLKMTGSFKEHKRYFKPKVRIAALDAGAAVTANQVKAAGWIDTGAPAVPHYGLKVYHPGPIASGGVPGISSSIAYSVYATVYIACKNVR